MIYIRADANEWIATGHIMRCLSIAEGMKMLGAEVGFITADEYGTDIVRNCGFSCRILNSAWNDLEQEIDILCKILQAEDKLFIDSYFVTEKYLNILNQKTTVIYLDDLNQFEYTCRMLINYSVYAEDCGYREDDSKRKLLLGCDYVPLRKVFGQFFNKKIKEKVDRVLVLTGGADSCHFAVNFLHYIMENSLYQEITFDVIVGKYGEDGAELERWAGKRKNIHIHQNVTDIHCYMRKADMAVSAGGTTLYELCACGTPTICYMLADNQRRNVERFSNMGLMLSAGDIRNEGYLERLRQQMDELMENMPLRKRMSLQMRKLIDGKGAERIAKAVIEL